MPTQRSQVERHHLSVDKGCSAPGASRAGTRYREMQLLSFFKRRPVTPPQDSVPERRQVTIEWQYETGSSSEQIAQIRSDNGHSLFALVTERPPEGRVAQVREQDASYPVEVQSVVAVGAGFELELEYQEDGRRRERRVRSEGGALLLAEGTAAPVQVEVLNVSAGGMQLFATQPVSVGSAGRLYATDTDRMCSIRYCRSAAGGYRIGVQFYAENEQNRQSLDGL